MLLKIAFLKNWQNARVPFLVKLQARGDNIFVAIFAWQYLHCLKHYKWKKHVSSILGKDFPKSISYHSTFLKIRFSGSFCFIAFSQMCEILAEIFGLQLISKLPDLGETSIITLQCKTSFWRFLCIGGF